MNLSQKGLLEIHKELALKLKLNLKADEIQVIDTDDRSVERPLETFDITYEAYSGSFLSGRFKARVFLTKNYTVEEIRYPLRIE
jgi:hypothetical protein